jgi:pyruvate,orthophosphate dikinase
VPKHIYLFSDLDRAEAAVEGDWDAVRGLLGGKGANIADMTRLGIPVPPGFTATTETCKEFLAGGGVLSEEFRVEADAALAALEAATGKRFGDPADPLLLSCRSGAKFSMPGMMDTVLNLGLNDEVAAGIAERTGDARFAYDLYRRLLHMYGSVVLGIEDEAFESVLSERKRSAGVSLDGELGGDDWRAVCGSYGDVIERATGRPFPRDPRAQLLAAIEAVFRSWNGKRAIDYRNAAGIPHDLGTAVNVQVMVFGNSGPDSATGVYMSRDATTGERVLEGDYLENAQGEDVVAGIRATEPIARLAERSPALHARLEQIAAQLEHHHREMQDIEFTIDNGELWVLQTRTGKRTAQAAVRIAVDMADEGLITRSDAVERVAPEQVAVLLHPKLDPNVVATLEPLAEGLAVSPGAAVGRIVFDADEAERLARHGPVVLARPDTRPDDVHGMLAARGIITTRGGRTSHAALVARQFGRPAVVGVADLDIDLEAREARVGSTFLRELDPISIDGTSGLIYAGEISTVPADLEGAHLAELLAWADELRALGVRANADYPRDAERARAHGAEGIGLCRTEHMFFEPDRLPLIRAMIMATDDDGRRSALDALLPLQRGDFEGLFRAMDGLPVIIRLIDPPLHEFLPSSEELRGDIERLEDAVKTAEGEVATARAHAELNARREYLERAEELHEDNPMLGTRGVRLGMLMPDLVRMQVRAIMEAASTCVADGVTVLPEIMVPLVAHVNELRSMRSTVDAEAQAVAIEQGTEIPYRFGTMIEVPRAAVTAAEIAELAEFFSFGTNDLTQMTYGVSRDDAEGGFLVEYLRRGVLPRNPFVTIDADGVGRLMEWAVRDGRGARPDLEFGICGEHGGDPESIALCHRLGLDYVSCSPFRVPVARLAAAHAALQSPPTPPAPG